MSHNFKPIFIISLPRSGSTLLQRMLCGNQQIISVAEPWILLPLVYLSKQGGSASEYNSYVSQKACRSFIMSKDKHPTDYDMYLKNFVMNLYSRQTNQGTQFFIDKTPRYTLILEDIYRIFGNSAKYIILTRNLLQIGSSMMDTWGKKGDWNLFHYDIDFFRGAPNMYEFSKYGSGNYCHVSYESLVTDPKTELGRIEEYLGIELIDYSMKLIESKRSFDGFGDKIGIRQYSDISCESLNKWRLNYCNFLRAGWVKKLRETLDEEVLTYFGCTDESLNYAQSSKGVEKIFTDLVKFAYGKLHRNFNIELVKNKRHYSGNDDSKFSFE